MIFWQQFLLAALMLLWTSSSALSASDGVHGYVLKSPTGVPAVNSEVILYVQQQGQWNEVQRQRTDAQGRFQFSGSLVGTGTNFSLSALYQGIPHFTSVLEAGAQQQVIIEVYEPRQNEIPELRIGVYHLFLALREDELDVAHLVQVDNLEEWTYLGREGIDGQRWVTEFVLPAKLFGLQSHAGNLVAAGQDLFFDTQPLLPGLTQISFSFTLDARQLRRGYLHEPKQPTDQLDVFLYPSSFNPGPPFEDLGVVDLHGAPYRRLRLTSLAPGQSTLIPLPLSSSLRWTLKWVALSLALLAALLVPILSRRAALTATDQATRMAPDALRRHGDQLIEQLAILDDSQVGSENLAHYQAERTRLLEQARTAFRLLEEQQNGQ